MNSLKVEARDLFLNLGFTQVNSGNTFNNHSGSMHPNDQVFSLNVEATMVKTIHRFGDSGYKHDSDHAIIIFKVHEQVKLT